MEGDSRKITVFIVEDNEMTRLAIKGVVSKVSEFSVVGEAGDGESAVKQVLQIKPQIVLVDIGLPLIDGVEATKQIKKECPEIKAVMLTAHDSDADIFASFDAGADGYITKEGFSQRLELAIRSVSEGVAWLDPHIARRVLKAATDSMKTIVGARTPSLTLVAPLSEQETEVLEQVAAEQPLCKDGVCLIDPEFMKKLHRFHRDK